MTIPTPPRAPCLGDDAYNSHTGYYLGMVAMAGGKNKTAIRNATPPNFRDILIAIARTAS